MDRRLPLRWIVIVALAPFACAALAVGGTLYAAGASDRAVDAAEARWRARGYSAYRMVVAEPHCTIDVEVRDGHIESVEPWTRCNLEGVTVEKLFALARRDGDTGARCIVQGCACDDVLTVQTEYHPELGYPTEIYVRIQAQPNWRHPDAWQLLLRSGRAPACSALVGDKFVRVSELAPLP